MKFSCSDPSGGPDVSVDIPVSVALFQAATWLRSRFSDNPLRRLSGSIGFVSSRLFALREGTVFGEWKAAPLIKPLGDGKAALVCSGFPVSGLYDVFGQLAVGHALGRIGRSFEHLDDQSPGDFEGSSLICFGSPTSNLISGSIFDKLLSVLNSEMQWSEHFNSFKVGNSKFVSGDDGVVVAYDSPWNSARSVLVIAGIGPTGTFAGAQLLTRWSKSLPARHQRRSRRFVAAVTYEGMNDVPRVSVFRKLK